MLGKNIRSGIYARSAGVSSILEYTNFGVNGEIPLEKMNASLVAVQAGLGRDTVAIAIQRIVKHLSERIYAKNECALEIPNVGRLFIRKGIAAVRFNSELNETAKRVQSARSRSSK